MIFLKRKVYALWHAIAIFAIAEVSVQYDLLRDDVSTFDSWV